MNWTKADGAKLRAHVWSNGVHDPDERFAHALEGCFPRADIAASATHDAVIATVARIRDWMAIERDTGKDLDGLLDAILKDAGEGK